MIDFACKRFSLDEVIRCGLGLTKSEFKVFKFFISKSNSFFPTSDIESQLGLDLSTVQRAVKHLHEKNILERHQKNLGSGGYVFVYKSKPRDQIKAIVMEIVKNWSQRVEEEFDKW